MHQLMQMTTLMTLYHAHSSKKNQEKIGFVLFEILKQNVTKH